MKDYNEIANRVFQRRDEYLEEKKRKKVIFFRRAAIAFSCCLMMMVGVGISQMDLIKKSQPSPDKDTYITTDYNESTETTAKHTVTTDLAAATTISDTSASTSDKVTTHTTAVTYSDKKTDVTVTSTRKVSDKNNASTSKNVRTTASGMEIIVTSRSSSGNIRTTTTSAKSVQTSTTAKRSTTTSRHTTTTSKRSTTTTTRSPVFTTTTTVYKPRTTTTTTTTHATQIYTSATTITYYTSTTRHEPPPVFTTIVYTTMPHYSYTTTTTPPPTSTTPIPTTTTAETSILPCLEFIYNNTTYTLAKTSYTLEVNETDKLLYSGNMYSDTLNEYIDYKVYRYENIDPRFICKVTFDEIDEVYVGINYKFVPKDNADFLAATDNMNCFVFDDIYDMVFSDTGPLNQEAFIDILKARPSTPVIDTIHDDTIDIAYADFSLKGIYTILDKEIRGQFYFLDNDLIEFYLSDYPELCQFFIETGESNIDIITQIMLK